MRWPFSKRSTEDVGANTPGAAVSAYLDGEVTPAERAQLEREISAQPDLSSTLEAFRETKALLQAMPEEAPRRSFALTPEMVRAAAPAPISPPQRVQAPKRPPFLLYVGQAAAGIGVLGLTLVGASTLFSGSSSSDDSGGMTSMAANKDGHATGEIMSTTSGSLADSAGGAQGAATAAAEAPAVPENSPQASGSNDNSAPPPSSTCVPNPAGGQPICNDILAIPTAAAVDPDTRNSAPPGVGSEDAFAQTAETALAYDASADDGGGPSGRQLAFIVFAVIAAAGGSAWLAVAVRRAREDGEPAG